LAIPLSLLTVAINAQAGEWIKGSASNAAGSRNYQLWVPSGYDKRVPTPLVMMLHGCKQKPEDLAAISGMNLVADRNKFLVVYPEQTKEANPLQCWNWFDPKHQESDSGEPALLAAIVHQVYSSHNVDGKRVYVAGISAGGAMAVVMGATYPDVFSAIGVSSGLAFKAGTDVQSGLAAMKQGAPNPKQLVLEPFESMRRTWGGLPHRDKRRMPIIVFHGDADPYVNPINADQIILQWAQTNDLLYGDKEDESVKAQPAKSVDGLVAEGRGYTRSIYIDRAGKVIMEKWIVKGMGHAWSGSPTAGPFADPKGPNASEEMWRFFVETSSSSKSAKLKAAKPKGRP